MTLTEERPVSTDIDSAPRGRAGCLVAGVLLTVVVLAATTVSIWYGLSGSTPRYLEIQHQTYRHPIDRIEFDIGGGDITVAAGNGGDVEVTRQVRWSRKQRKEAPTPSESWTGTTLHIARPRCSDLSASCSTDYLVQLPAAVIVDARTSGGSITTQDMTRDQILQTSGGDLRVSGATGRLKLTSSGGSITGLGLSSPDTEAVTQGGGVSLWFGSVPSTVDVWASGGDADVAVPRAAGGAGGYRVRAAASSGNSIVEVTDDPTAPHTVAVRSQGGDVHVHYSN
jgi:hypothetical protein